MMICWILVLSLLLWTSSANVIDLSGYEFDEFKSELENYDAIFVKFYAPYCGHCKSMAHDFVKTAEEAIDFNVALAEVDCTSATGTEICHKYKVHGYPTLKLFRNGFPYKEYSGGRTAKDMTQWLKINAVIESKRFSSFTELNRAIERADEPVIFAVFENNKEPIFDRWIKAAKKVKEHWQFHDLLFYHIFEEYSTGSIGHLRSIGLSEQKTLKSPAIIMVRPKWLENKFEPKSIVYNKKSKQDIAEWILWKTFGKVLFRTRESAHDLYKPPIIVAYYDFDFKRQNKRTHFWRNRLMKKAEEYPELTFAISNSQVFRKILSRKEFEPPQGDDNPLFIAYDIFGVIYPMRENFTMEAFDNFIQSFKNGSVWPHIKSEQPKKDDGAVRSVVGISFAIDVTYNPKDVFISFYAPWCKHSQELEPVWKELAEQLKDEPGIEISMYNAVANEVPSELPVETYPTVYFIPKTTKKAIKYTAGKDIHNFLQFLASHSTDEMVGYDRKGARKSSATIESTGDALKTEL